MNVDMNALIELSRLSTIGLAVLICATAVVGIVGLFRAPESTVNVMFAVVHSGSIIRMGTAILIVLAIFGLRILDKVSAEATIATLSGIAGYLLGTQGPQGNSSAKSERPTATASPPPAPPQ